MDKGALFIHGTPVVLVALHPRFARLTRAPAFWGPKAVAAHTLYRTATYYVMRYEVGTRVMAWAEREQLAREALRGRLGREPTADEIMADSQRRTAR